MADGYYRSYLNSAMSLFDINITIESQSKSIESGVTIDLEGIVNFITLVEPAWSPDKLKHLNTSIHLEGLNIINGYTPMDGGVIYVKVFFTKLYLTLVDCVFKNNTAVSSAAVLHIRIDYHSTVIGYDNPPVINIDGCRFLGNSANEFTVLYSNNGNATISNSIFQDNYTSRNGIVFTGGRVQMFQCLFFNNTANQMTLFLLKNMLDTVRIDGTEFIGNTIQNTKVPTITPSIIAAIGAQIQFSNCLFESNVNASQVFQSGYQAVKKGSSTFDNCTFSNNRGDIKGAGIYSLLTKLIIQHSTFNNNSGYLGSHIYAFDTKEVSISNSSFTNSPPNTFGSGQSIYLFNIKNMNVSNLITRFRRRQRRKAYKSMIDSEYDYNDN
ncbi:hypothetical protein PPL_06085 [Heterostelium album PN500]|uniref:Uncharacterized protein n=1 Tax=Heterostelium pallidum (strain ATCC 26659 / Pp 5 / PN500) TaxID=670386 RepID=D3BC63_HETP5|nr:hypothetical protein PPL_06085 [Heterostelium album PN500]EFA81246.1 hypothetical protein PPL_06085 [Heterostelium album PN500]|eukprot:XP_020433364.1 hypothetical protein PPL_06085 [Heterostelium album PN500]